MFAVLPLQRASVSAIDTYSVGYSSPRSPAVSVKPGYSASAMTVPGNLVLGSLSVVHRVGVSDS